MAIHTMHKKKGEKGFMAIKMDLEKVYDWINQNFLEYTVKDIRFNNHFVTLIQVCVTTCNMHVFWNGELKGQCIILQL